MKKSTGIFIGKKTGELFLTLVIVTMISFVLMQFSPIDAATAYARRNAFAITPDTINSLREKMGLNDSLPVQYFNWVADSVHLDFGTSYVNGRDVFTEVTNAFGITASIVLISAVLQAIGILLVGCICYGMRRNWLGSVLNFICIAGISIPAFFFAGTFIDIFAVRFQWMSVAGNTGFMRYFPAALCLSIGGIAFFGQLLAGNINKGMTEDSAVYSRCRGLTEKRILLFHALPGAVYGLLPNFMQMLGLCMAGSMIVERIFSLPGLGYLIVDSVLFRDSPMIHATILYLAFSLVIFNILSDIIKRILQGGAVNSEVKG
ncbi:peptide/nickel transport system permease protein [Ruminiclostridium sufflavum DSM 19573]|uniref:Peptide/nickel transport system permease protein n=1 Tax=Ruminiclostridium sufflavum DSM 19573 TaxID=1121337 RepID=A0A318Y3V9_9FIRM|nr:ABC transporter permease [Ruminiclostridium sufflavum]PYG90258.1 peptide/nickel transport system permease protein [Ruminiclostridium sufflavum DSM 19573]